MTDANDKEASESLPPSCRYVLDALDAGDEPLTLDDLDSQLCHRRSTIEWAVRQLKDSGYVRVDRDSDDLRQVAVTLRSERTFTPHESDT
jgi:DNA-binding MarR family transcriptional regulator